MNRDFKGIWIPRELWERNDLSTSEKIILLEVDSLDEGIGCFAKNSHFASLIGVTNGTIENILSKLKEKKQLDIVDRAGKRYLMLHEELAHEKMGIITENPRKNGLEGQKAHEKIGSISSNTAESNTTTVVTASPCQKQVVEKLVVEDKPVKESVKVDWSKTKSELQVFMGDYIKMNLPAVYAEADKKQVSGFFMQYSFMFKRMLATAGSLEVARMALVEAEKYYRRLGYPWGLKALNGNFGEFVNQVMEKKRRV